MIDDDTKERLIEQFRACLDSSEDELGGEDDTLDLRSLLAEMAVLKNEVRLQARHVMRLLICHRRRA